MSKHLPLPALDDRDLGEFLYQARLVRDWRWLWLRKRSVTRLEYVDTPQAITVVWNDPSVQPTNPPLTHENHPGLRP